MGVTKRPVRSGAKRTRPSPPLLHHMKRKSVIAGAVVLAVCLGFWTAWIRQDQSGIGYYDSKNVDWSERREEVRQAFISSWDAYSEHAWGKSSILP